MKFGKVKKLAGNVHYKSEYVVHITNVKPVIAKVYISKKVSKKIRDLDV